MKTVDEDDLGHSPLVHILPVGRQVTGAMPWIHFRTRTAVLKMKPVEAAQDLTLTPNPKPNLY